MAAAETGVPERLRRQGSKLNIREKNRRGDACWQLESNMPVATVSV